ncbi:MAG: hypothetical protein ILA03_01480 [Bacteroidaceae bacterium]|nr:hypothetical protein [Bacteroidaceae bacterium]
MNKKLLIPIVLCTIIVIAVISTCVGGGSKIKLQWNAVLPPEEINDSIELKVYVENSGSMDAYMCAGSNLKDAVFDYVSDLKRLTTSCSLYYINSKVIPYNGELNSYIKDLTPQSFAKAGGDRSNTDLRDIFEKIIRANGKQSVSVFVSDCILDIPENAIDFFGNCQVSIKNTFNEALSANPDLGVEIIKLDSKFEGYWYCGHNRELLRDVKRPYYIWVIGDQRYLADFNKKVPVENIIGGIKEYGAYAAPQIIPFDITKSTYVTNHSGKINVEVLINLRGSLQSGTMCKNTALYKSANPAQVTVASVNEITDASNRYSHVVTLEIENPETLRSETLTFSYPHLATWVSNSDDTTGANVKENLDRTTGLMALIKGVAEAYKNSTTYGSVSFELKNK